MPDPTLGVAHLLIYPQEDSAAHANRVNWWLLPEEDERQAIARHHEALLMHPYPEEDFPDMFTEGRKRLQ